MLWLIAILITIFPYSTALSSIEAIKPEDVLSHEAIAEIKKTENYFFRKSIELGREQWNIPRMEYSRYFFKYRDQSYTLEQVVDETLNNGFPLRYKIEDLRRAGLEHYTAWGNLIPRVNLSLGEGLSPINMNSFFQNLFGFLMPQHWFELEQTKQYKKVSESLLLKTALDEAQNAELHFLNLHKDIRDLEILNFYYIHLQLLSQNFTKEGPEGLTLDGMFGQVGTDVGKTIGGIIVKFNDLAFLMGVEKSRDGYYNASALNLTPLENFPKSEADITSLHPEAVNKENFIELAVNRSVELEIIKDLFTVSRLDIGVAGAGNILSDNSRSYSPQLGLRFGFDTIPRILIAKSKNRTAQINVEHELVKIVDLSRRAHDTYTSSRYAYASSSFSYLLNQKAFIANLEDMLLNSYSHKSVAIFLNSFQQMLNAELIRNAIFHLSLKAKAQIKRLMFTNANDAENLAIAGLLEKSSLNEELTPEDMHLQHIFASVHKTKDLKLLLSGKVLIFKLIELKDKPLGLLVQKHIKVLVKNNPWSRKSRNYYRCLYDYLTAKMIFVPEKLFRKIRKRAKVPKPVAKKKSVDRKKSSGKKINVFGSVFKPLGYQFKGRDYFNQLSETLEINQFMGASGI